MWRKPKAVELEMTSLLEVEGTWTPWGYQTNHTEHLREKKNKKRDLENVTLTLHDSL